MLASGGLGCTRSLLAASWLANTSGVRSFERYVRAALIAFAAPRLDQLYCIGQWLEPIYVEAFIAQGAVS